MISFSKREATPSAPSVTADLKVISDELNRQFKAQIVIPGESPTLSDKSTVRVPTTSFMLNLLLGGGTPLGRVLEVSGDPSEGKSTIIEHMMIGFQRYPGVSVLLDAESGWCRQRALRIGHNPSRHMHLQADTVELGFSAINALIKKMRMPGGKFPLSVPIGIFWDTISASQTEGEKTGDYYADGMMDKPRKIRRALRTLSLVLPETNCTLVFVNQTIQGPSRTGASKSQTPGGGAIKFWSSKRLKVWSFEKMQYPENNTGILTHVKTIKDKLEPPGREIVIPIRYSDGVDNLYEVLNFLMDNSKYVNMSSGWVSVPDFPEPECEARFRIKKAHDYYNEHPDLLEYLQLCASEVWGSLRKDSKDADSDD